MKVTLKKTLSVLAAGLLGCALLCQQAQAVPITGNITFKGGVTLNTANVGTATQVTAWLTPQVDSRDGSFAGIAVNAPVTMTAPWTFTAGLANLWSVGGFTFNLTSSAILFQNATGLLVQGTGTITGPAGFDATQGSWRFSTQSPGSGTPLDFSFSGATGSAVPDGGLTVALLGFALMGIAGLRRKLSK